MTKRKATKEHYRTLADQLGYTWLGSELPKNALTKTQWLCPNSHEREVCYSELKRGKKCALCVGNVRKIPADYRTLAQKLGIRWLGPEAKNSSKYTNWECPNDHVWSAPYASIQRSLVQGKGNGCKRCAEKKKADKTRKKQSDYHALAKASGLTWLGPAVDHSNEHTNWRCKEGHVWSAPYSRIYMGHGCRVCAGKAEVL